MTPPTYLRDITWLARIQVILKLSEASSPKINFSECQVLHADSYKEELIKQDKWYGDNFPLKLLRYILVVVSFIIPVGTK